MSSLSSAGNDRVTLEPEHLFMTQTPADSTRVPGAEPLSPVGSVLVIANTRSGQDGAIATRMLQHARNRIASMQLQVVGLPPEQGDIGEQLTVSRKSPADVVIAIGGDGTINGAAQVAIHHDARLVVVPTGTLNLVASDLGVEATEEHLDASLIGWREIRIDVGYVNDHLFLHSSHLGLVPSLAHHRERVRAAAEPADRIASTKDWLAGCVQAPEQTITCTDGERTATLTTRAVAVTVNLLAESKPLHYVRPRLDEGVLGVYASAHAGTLATVNAVASLALGRFPSDPDTLHATCKQLDVCTDSSTITLCNDGELVDLLTPCRFRLEPKALRVLVPGEFSGGSG